ncbi:MAG: tol-pal system protein YbgF [Gammaproteobacteria bacterium]
MALGGADATLGQGYAPVIEGRRNDPIEGHPAPPRRGVENRGILHLLDEVKKLSRDVQRLRGDIEVQAHKLQKVERRQVKLNTDLDQRLKNLEGVIGGQPPTLDPSAAYYPPPVPAGVGPSGAPVDPASIDPTRVPQPAGAPAPVAGPAPLSEGDAYERAFNFLKMGDYKQSIPAFKDFLVLYPRSEQADSAQYWLAEAYYVDHQYEPAIAEYDKLVQGYPESKKLTHALLKIGYSHYELGQMDLAKQSLQDLQQRYPGTVAASHAEERLRRIKLEHP